MQSPPIAIDIAPIAWRAPPLQTIQTISHVSCTLGETENNTNALALSRSHKIEGVPKAPWEDDDHPDILKV